MVKREQEIERIWAAQAEFADDEDDDSKSKSVERRYMTGGAVGRYPTKQMPSQSQKATLQDRNANPDVSPRILKRSPPRGDDTNTPRQHRPVGYPHMKQPAHAARGPRSHGNYNVRSAGGPPDSASEGQRMTFGVESRLPLSN